RGSPWRGHRGKYPAWARSPPPQPPPAAVLPESELFSKRGAPRTGAMIEQKLPLYALRLKRLSGERRIAFPPRALADLDEPEWIPRGQANRLARLRQFCENGMGTHLTEPIARVVRIRLLAMHNAVPVRAIHGMRGLCNL